MLPRNLTEMTRAERLQYRFFTDAMRRVEYDLRHAVWAERIVPMDWHRALSEEPVPAKTRLTIRLDADLVKFFRKLGPGYQGTINRVLRAFVKARMAGFVTGPERLDVIAEGLLEDRQGETRPEIGDFERLMEEVRRKRAEEG